MSRRALFAMVGATALGLALWPNALAQPSPAAPGSSAPAAGAPAAGDPAAGDPAAGDPVAGAPADPLAAARGASGRPAIEPRPSLVERILFNPRERTAAARRALERGDATAAAARAETALRLAPDDPAVRYNAGTARLEAGLEGAAELLEAAAGGEEPVASRAHYNVGNLRFGEEDFAEAVAAYQRALLADPGFDDAKFNLELARRRLEEQQQNQQPGGPPDPDQDGQPQDDGESQGDGQPQDDGNPQEDGEPQDDGDPENNGEPEDEGPPQDEGDGQGDQEPQDGDQPPEGSEQPSDQPPPDGSGAGQQERPLPQFENLPDMTAEEAAAILEAIENLEREQRTRQALETARQAGRAEKDW
ncbi:MAG: hypothetical protein AAGN46_11700 [Acidobacteriota bacterium]